MKQFNEVSICVSRNEASIISDLIPDFLKFLMNVIQDAPQHMQQKQQVSIIMTNKTSMNNHAPKDVPKTFQDLKNSLEIFF